MSWARAVCARCGCERWVRTHPRTLLCRDCYCVLSVAERDAWAA